MSWIRPLFGLMLLYLAFIAGCGSPETGGDKTGDTTVEEPSEPSSGPSGRPLE